MRVITYSGKRSVRFVYPIVVLALLIGTTTRAIADISVPDLPIGSQYQLIFVTQGKSAATSADIDTYNHFVNEQAALNPLLPHTTWHAVASVPGVDARVNAPSFGLPVYNTQAILVSPANPDLYNWSGGGVLNPILYDQFGSAYDGGLGSISAVWTGSDYLGVGRSGARLGEGIFPGIGSAKFTGTRWLVEAYGGDATLPLYALSDPLTVVPEAGSLVLTLFAIVGIALSRIRPSQRGYSACVQ